VILLALGVVLASGLGASPAAAQIGRGGQSIELDANATENKVPPQIDGLTVQQRLGQKVPLDLKFTDVDGVEKPLRDWFSDGRPVLMTMVYFRCPMVCPLTLERLTQRLREITDWNVGREFNVVVVSFDPSETAQVAAAKKFEYVTNYGRGPAESVERGWAWLTSEDPSRARSLADALGFPYRYLPASNEYSHATVFFAVTPDGTISRYLNGLDTSAKEVRLSLLDAGQGKLGGVLDTFWQMCFTFDAHAGSYTVAAFRVMQFASVGIVVVVGGLIGAMLLIERRRRSRVAIAASGVGRAAAVGGVGAVV
jgi:protein SCO1/2